MYHSKLKFLLILLLGMRLQAMEAQSTSNTTLQHVASNMNKALKKSDKKTNSVSCPLGVAQTLASLSLILKEDANKQEIEKFTGDPKLTKNMGSLNKLISQNLKAKEEGKKFTMNNGLYAFFSSALKIPEEIIKKFKKLGSKIDSVDFSKSKKAADKINNIVKQDTEEKIKEIVKENELDNDTVSVLLHTLYLKSEWLLNKVKKSKLSYSDKNKDIYTVTSFEFKKQKVRLLQDKNVSFIALPMAGNSYIIIRHNNKHRDLKYITQEEITELMKSRKQEVNFEAPFVSMAKTIDLKELLKEQMPKTLNGSFPTKLDAPVIITKYIQMLTFDMNDKGAEASSATKASMSRGISEEHPVDIKINSPFSIAWIKEMAGEYYVLFQAQVVDTNVMKDAVLVTKNQSEETSKEGSHRRRRNHSHSSGSASSDHTGSSGSSTGGKKPHRHEKPDANGSSNANNQFHSVSLEGLNVPIGETIPDASQQHENSEETESDDACQCIVF